MSLDAEAQRALRCVTAEDLRGRVPPEVLAEALGPDGIASALIASVPGQPNRCLASSACGSPASAHRCYGQGMCAVFPDEVGAIVFCLRCCDKHACGASRKVLP